MKKRKIKEKKIVSIKIKEIKQIKIEELVKIYKQGKVEVIALRGMNVTFLPGINLIMGPSGCGKTTLLNLIGGIDKVTAGKIIIGSKDITKFNDNELDIYRRNHIGFIFQMFNLVQTLTGYENIELPMILSNQSSNEREQRILSLAKLLKIEDRTHHKPEELSGGEQQRFAIAAALANNPDIILCDEPTGELDSNAKNTVLDALRELSDNFPDKIVIIVSHDFNTIKIADYIYIIKDGVITEEYNKEKFPERFIVRDVDSKLTEEEKKKLSEVKEDLKALLKKIENIELK